MITTGEISRISANQGVRQQQIEKDYVIVWLLWGISQNEFLKEYLVFKGGTCLKKMHIEDYRFSEDMDFTLKDDGISNEKILSEFKIVFNLIYEETRLRLSINSNSEETHQTSGSMKFYINYIGVLGGRGDHVKIDITRGEKLEYEPLYKNVFLTYSDLQDDFTIQCYGLPEVLVEKMVALMGRTIPRDLYDFDYLTTIEKMDVKDIYFEFERKAKHKELNPKDFIAKVTSKEGILKKAWEENLKHQIKELPKFTDVWRNLNKQFRKIEKIIK